MNEQNVKNKDIKWWMPEYGFFGKFYMDGDDSFDGYLAEKKQSLSERTQTEIHGVIDLLGLRENNK